MLLYTIRRLSWSTQGQGVVWITVSRSNSALVEVQPLAAQADRLARVGNDQVPELIVQRCAGCSR